MSIFTRDALYLNILVYLVSDNTMNDYRSWRKKKKRIAVSQKSWNVEDRSKDSKEARF